MTFLSNENKGLLWELIKETGIFDKLINVVSRNKIMEIFEELLLKIDNNNLSITEKNKKFLSEYMMVLNQLYQPEIYQERKDVYINIETKEQMKKQREELFEERLRLKQEEFLKFQPQKPAAINFLEKEQDIKFEPQKDFIDLTNIPYTNTINMNEVKEVKEVKKKVSFQDLFKKELKEEIKEKEYKEEIKELKEELNEIKQLLIKISNKLEI